MRASAGFLSLVSIAFSQSWTQLNPSGAAPAARASASVARDPSSNRLIVFGGSNGGANLNGIWSLSNANGLGGAAAWTSLAADGSATAAPLLAPSVYDAANNRLIVSNGRDTWVLLNANGQGGALSWSRLTPPGAPALARLDHRLFLDASTNRLMLFGGCEAPAGAGDPDCSQQPTMVLVNANGLGGAAQWIELVPSNQLPDVLLGQGYDAYDPASNRIVTFGGAASAGGGNAVWALTNANGLGGVPQWVNVLPNNVTGAPPARLSGSAVFDSAKNKLAIFGGADLFAPTATLLNDVWVLSNANGLGGTPMWTQLVIAGGKPSPRESPAAVYDAVSNRMTVFGGETANGVYSNQAWVLDNVFSCGAGGCPPPPPVITAPSNGQTVPVSGVTFQWNPLAAVVGYNLRISRSGQTVFEGNLSGAGSISTLVSLSNGTYSFSVRGCTGEPFGDANCGAFASTGFTVALTAPPGAPAITAPSQNQNFTTSTQQFSWTSVANASAYEVELRDQASGGEIVLSLANAAPATSTIFSMRASTNYELRVRACQSACGPWSVAVNFSVTLPAVPAAPPPAPACSLATNVLNCSWPSVANADFYTVQAVNPTAFNGGALTVASRRTTALTTASPEPPLRVPNGNIAVFVAGCNGNGCGPYSPPANLTASSGNPSAPTLGTPIPGSEVTSNPVQFSWNRIPGDTGSNTIYRLYVQDFSRGAPALDVLTVNNFHAAAFKGEGSRYDAVVVANPDLPSQVVGPATAFNVRAVSPVSPTLVQPRHQVPGVAATIPSGNVTLGWTPVPAASLYEYFVAVAGQSSAAARGVTPGLLVQAPLPAGANTTYSGIVRACPQGASCALGSDVGWGPWSNAPGGAGVTTFIVRP